MEIAGKAGQRDNAADCNHQPPIPKPSTILSNDWGDTRDDACLHGNFADQTAVSKLNLDNKPEIVFLCSDGHIYTAPVGTYLPNAFGLHDMQPGGAPLSRGLGESA